MVNSIDNNSSHSSDPRYHTGKAKRALRTAKANDAKFKMKRVPLKDGKGYKLVKVRIDES